MLQNVLIANYLPLTELHRLVCTEDCLDASQLPARIRLVLQVRRSGVIYEIHHADHTYYSGGNPSKGRMDPL